MQSQQSHGSIGHLEEHFAGLSANDFTTPSSQGVSDKWVYDETDSLFLGQMFGLNLEAQYLDYYSWTVLSNFAKQNLKHQYFLDARWIFKAINSSDENGIEILGSTVDGMNNLIERGDFSRIDRVLAEVPVGVASRHVLLLIARSTFPVRQKLSGWKPFVVRLHQAFVDRGLNADKLLKGLVE